MPQPAPQWTSIDDTRYKFRVGMPGVPADKSANFLIEESAPKGGSLVWRTYSSTSPSAEGGVYTASVKVFETESTDTAVLFSAGESDASQTIGAPLIGRSSGTFGAAKLPSMTLSYQTGGAGAVTGKVVLIVKDRHLYELVFFYSGGDRGAIGEKFFQSFQLVG